MEEQWHGKPRLIFDNGGGITLQLPGWCHHYIDAIQCSEDILLWRNNHNTNGWDGNEPESVFDPTQDEISNGGYRVYLLSEFQSNVITEDDSWGNIVALKEAMV